MHTNIRHCESDIGMDVLHRHPHTDDHECINVHRYWIHGRRKSTRCSQCIKGPLSLANSSFFVSTSPKMSSRTEATRPPLAGLGFLPPIFSSYSLIEHGREMSTQSDSSNARSQVSCFPSPSEENIVYPRLPSVEPQYTPELDSDPGSDSTLERNSSNAQNEEMEDTCEKGYEAGCEGEGDAIARRIRLRHKRRYSPFPRVQGVSPSGSTYKRAKSYAASGLGLGVPFGVAVKAHRRPAHSGITEYDRARAYNLLGLGRPSSAAQSNRKPGYSVTAARMRSSVMSIAPSPSLLPTPRFSLDVASYPYITPEVSTTVSPPSTPPPATRFPIHLFLVQHSAPPTFTSEAILHSPPQSSQHSSFPSLTPIGLGLGINVPIAPSPAPEFS
ncbi:uncharacterized protein LAESUDRAFT_750061 [Laetiporus sulphureus 93-53]|uniref:Uncharacterized protein n=1 Tax=Laetiporus sulphureus 93-53 TaxID=1314785 RepID=A0A165E4D1_9APHY|nr:uncharacterized protein LAESUDRAFT_750061 [Laetiporus sulphureus 93-53]KZT06224.1 hypothetical protein LAESUDRAFT_750061 [Laetiporus sulphureus 93-53]